MKTERHFFERLKAKVAVNLNSINNGNVFQKRKQNRDFFLRPITTELIHSSAAFTTKNIKESSSGRNTGDAVG